jgi:hypothetical protein
MTNEGHRVGQAIVQNLPVPQKHPLRNFDPEKLSKVMADENFQVDTRGMSPQEYGMFLADLTGETILDFQKQMSNPNSPLRQAQKTDLASRLGSEGASMRMVTLPGARSAPGGYAAGTYHPEGLNPGVVKDLVESLGRQDFDKDILVLSKLANDTTMRHELAHRGVSKLQDKGFRINLNDEEILMRLLDYSLGNDEDKKISEVYFKKFYNLTPEEIFNNPEIMELFNQVQEEVFKELGGAPIPEPSPIK